jgi:hypothetical protein
MGLPSGAITKTNPTVGDSEDRAGQTRIPKAPARVFDDTVASQKSQNGADTPVSTRDVQSKPTSPTISSPDVVAHNTTEPHPNFPATSSPPDIFNLHFFNDGGSGGQDPSLPISVFNPPVSAAGDTETTETGPPSPSPNLDFIDRLPEDDRIAAKEGTIASLRNRAAELENQLQNLPTDSFSGHVRPQLQAELDQVYVDLDALEPPPPAPVAESHILPDDPAERIATSDAYGNVLRGQGANLDLDDVEKTNDGEDHVIVQSIYDPVVSGKSTVVDEFSTIVTLPPGTDPQDFLHQLAGDVDGTLPIVRTHGDFRNQTDEPGVGTISEIDVNGGPFPANYVPSYLANIVDQSPINAPVVMTEYEPESHFVFQTIEHNANEHPLHGSREFGYEELGDGRVKIYTRAIAAPDIFGNKIVGVEPERLMWTAFIDGVDNYVTENGGEVHSRYIVQDTNGPTGDELWQQLPRDEQVSIRDSQVNGLEREIGRLEQEIDRLRSEGYDDFGIHGRIDDLESELAAWKAKDIKS